MTAPGSTASCPKCGATNIQFVPIKRASVPESVAAEYFRGMTPATGPGADTIQQSVCFRCGCRWIPRTAEEHHLRAVSGQLGPEAMRVAQAEDAAARAKGQQTSRFGKIPKRTLIIAAIMIVVILLALFTKG
jgi:hypothetical protein